MDTDKETTLAATVEPVNNKSQKSRKDINKLPKSAFALYIRLYCNQKSTKSLKHSSKMIEATKTWLTLSEFEKQKFYSKYKEYKQKYSDTIINCLQKSEPFMKKKDSRSQKKHLNVNEQPILEEDEIKKHLPDDDHQELDTTNVESNNRLEISDNTDNIDTEQIENACIEEEEEDNKTLQDPSEVQFLEPIPPNVKSGKELFEMIPAENNLTWTTLPQRERSLYNKAVLTMKRDFIQKYKIYLESLTQKQLFDHYNKCFHS